MRILKIISISAIVFISTIIAIYIKTKPNNPEQGVKSAITSAISNTISFGEFDYMTIDYLKNRQYEGSDITIEKELSKKANYTSYLTSYKSDELKINSLLTIPNTTKPEKGYPAIVFIHGYIPPSIYKTTEKYTDYVDYLARNGFVVFKIDLRGHGESEGEPRGAYYSPDYIVDALNAAASLQKHPQVDAEKIGMWGHSMAGNVTLRSVAASNKIKAAVIWAGAVYTYEDIQAYGIDDNSYRPPTDAQIQTQRQEQRQKMRDQFGIPNLEELFWSKVSPVNYLDQNSAKVQIHHAVNDDVVSIEYTRNLKKILSEKGIEIETYEYQSGGHNLISPAFTTAMQRTVEFYNANLK